MRKLLLLSTFFCVLSLSAEVEHRGKLLKSVVIAPDAPYTVEYAAGELINYVQKITGTRLKLFKDGKLRNEPSFYIGKSEAVTALNVDTQNLKSDGYIIKSFDNALVIAGNDFTGKMPVVGFRDPWNPGTVWNKKLKLGAFGDSGTLNGVYHLLQKNFGIRWYTDGDLGEVLPEKTAKLTIPELNLTVAPDFHYRFLRFVHMGYDNDGARHFKRMRLGGSKLMQVNHSFYVLRALAQANPEYCAMIDGKRDVAGKLCGGGVHLCLTNPDVIKAFADYINKYFDAHPEQTVFPVFPGDGLRRCCECPNCYPEVDRTKPDAGKFSYHIWKFVNAVAKQVAVRHPDKFVAGAAYHECSDVPPFPLEKNVTVLICKKRSAYLDPAYKADVRRRHNMWNQAAPGRLTFWDYYLDSRVPWANLPVIFTKTIAEDLRFMKSIGAFGEFIESSISKHRQAFPAMTHLNIYVTSQLYWNVDQDVDAMLEEYFVRFYGPAQKEMREFWLTAENRRNEIGAKFMRSRIGWLDYTLAPTEVFPPEVAKKMLRLLEDAAKKTAPGSIYRKRVEWVQNEFNVGAKTLIALANLKTPSMTIGKEFAPMQVFVSKNGEYTNVKTYVTMRGDSEKLHLRFICYEPRMKELERTPTKKIWARDGLEVFITQDNSIGTVRVNDKKCRQFYFNVAGAKWGALRDGRRILGGRNFGAETQVKFFDNHWQMDVSIPLKELDLDGKTPFYVNFYRYRGFGSASDSSNLSAWAPTGQFLHYCMDKFATVKWGKVEKLQDKVISPLVNSGSRKGKAWNPGGVGGNRAMAGNVNKTKRNDLLLLHFDLRAFYGKKVKKAIFRSTYALFGEKAPREYILEAIDSNISEPHPQDLTKHDVQLIKKWTIDSRKVYRIDVTGFVNDSLKKGHFWCKLRLRDPRAEREHNPFKKTAAVWLTNIALEVETE